MKILHLASYDEWTGAAAPAWEEVVALRRAGIDAHFAYMPGGDLESRVGRQPFSHGIVTKHQDPRSVYLSLSSLGSLQKQHRFSVLHSHLTHDHWLSILLVRGRRSVCIARTFHARRALRNGFIARRLVALTDGVCVSNASFQGAEVLGGRRSLVTPPPLDAEKFGFIGTEPGLAIPLGEARPVIGVIGKLAPERGFETAFRAFARLLQKSQDARLLIVGSGWDRQRLEHLAGELSIASRVVWCGHVDDDLAGYYRSMDVLLYASPGSEEGHRAVIEALGCGTPVAALPVAGVDYVLGELGRDMIAPAMGPESLGETAHRLVQAGRVAFSRKCSERAAEFRHQRAAERLLAFYEDTFRGGY